MDMVGTDPAKVGKCGMRSKVADLPARIAPSF
jgi:hypothetical protein